MPTVLSLRDSVRQRADLEKQMAEIEVAIADPIITAFGSFELVKRNCHPPTYSLRGGNSAGRLILTGHGDPFAPVVEVPGKDDEDAMHEALIYLFHRFDAGFTEFADLCRAKGLVMGEPAGG